MYFIRIAFLFMSLHIYSCAMHTPILKPLIPSWDCINGLDSLLLDEQMSHSKLMAQPDEFAYNMPTMHLDMRTNQCYFKANLTQELDDNDQIELAKLISVIEDQIDLELAEQLCLHQWSQHILDKALHHIIQINTPQAEEKAYLLLEAGANPHSVNSKGKTAFSVACKFPNNVMSAWLKNHNTTEELNPECPKTVNVKNLNPISLMQAVICDNFIAAKKLLKQGHNAQFSDADGNSILHWAIWFKGPDAGNRLSLVRALVGAGADCNDRNNRGETPLHIALYSYKFMNLALELIHLGADCSIVDNQGRSPVWSLVCSSLLPTQRNNFTCRQKHFEQSLYTRDNQYIELLLKQGVQVNKPDNHGLMPLARVVLAQKTQLARLLISYGAITDLENSHSWLYDFTLQNFPANEQLHQVLQTAYLDNMHLRRILHELDLKKLKKTITKDIPLNMAIDKKGNTLFKKLLTKANKYKEQKWLCTEMAKWLALHGADCSYQAQKTVCELAVTEQ